MSDLMLFEEMDLHIDRRAGVP